MNNRKRFEELKKELAFLEYDDTLTAYGLPPKGEGLVLLQNRRKEQNLRAYKKYESEVNKVVENFDYKDKRFKEIEGIKFGMKDYLWCRRLIETNKNLAQ